MLAFYYLCIEEELVKHVGTLFLLFACRRRSSEGNEESIMIESPLTELSEPSVPHSTTPRQVQ